MDRTRPRSPLRVWPLRAASALNSAVATGVNLLGDVHGGAGEQCITLLTEVDERRRDGEPIIAAATEVAARWRAERRYLPGFGHRFHPRDPRRDPLFSLVGQAVGRGLKLSLKKNSPLVRNVQRNDSPGCSRTSNSPSKNCVAPWTFALSTGLVNVTVVPTGTRR